LNTKEEKQILRKKLMFQRESISDLEKLSLDPSIVEMCSSLISTLPENQYWAGYRSLQNEASIDQLVMESIEKWVFPRVNGRTLDFYNCKNSKDFEVGSFGILEPKINMVRINIYDCSIIFVPGLAFDREMHRLGMGAGYYDRVLSSFNGIKVGVCYSEFVLNSEIPCETHDVAMDYVVTEKYILSSLIRRKVV
jgi:5-formyltetrahydrofolate cyclo-ligase